MGQVPQPPERSRTNTVATAIASETLIPNTCLFLHLPDGASKSHSTERKELHAMDLEGFVHHTVRADCYAHEDDMKGEPLSEIVIRERR